MLEKTNKLQLHQSLNDGETIVINSMIYIDQSLNEGETIVIGAMI